MNITDMMYNDIEFLYNNNVNFRNAIDKEQERLKSLGFDLSKLVSFQNITPPTGTIFKLNSNKEEIT